MNNNLEYNGHKFKVGTYALQYSLQKLGASINDLGEVVRFRLFDLIHSMMYYSHVYACMREDKPTELSESDIYDIMDETGGYTGSFFNDFVAVMNESLGLVKISGEVVENKKKAAKSTLRKTA